MSRSPRYCGVRYGSVLHEVERRHHLSRPMLECLLALGYCESCGFISAGEHWNRSRDALARRDLVQAYKITSKGWAVIAEALAVLGPWLEAAGSTLAARDAWAQAEIAGSRQP